MAAFAAAILFPSFAYCALPQPGQQYRWKASFRAELQQQGAAQSGLAVLSGEWVRTVVATRPGDYDVCYQLTSVQLEGREGKKVDSKELRLTEERLSKSFWVTYGKDGEMRSIRFLKDVSPSDRNLLQMIATESQFVQPDSHSSVWNTLERDGGGNYVAIYQQTDPSHIRKKKLKYVETGTAQKGSSDFRFTVEESDAKFAVNANGVVESLDGVQRIRLSLPDAQRESLVTHVEIHLADLRTNLDPALAATLSIPKGLDELAITTHQPDPKVAQQQVDEQLLAGLSTEAILTSAEKNDTNVAPRLAALFRRRPDAIAPAVARINGGPGTQLIASGLAQSGSDVAIQSLCGVVKDASRMPSIRVTALIALAGLKEPTVDAMRTPVAMMKDPNAQIRDAARLASGALARAGRVIHPAESEAIDNTLATAFAQAPTVTEKKELLGALGNSAGPKAEQIFRASLKDKSDDIRAAAARGLRLIPGAEIDALLAKTVKEDSSGTVRGAAIFAMDFRRPLTTPLWDAVLAAARYDSTESVRNRAIAMLRNDANRPPDSATTLEWISEHDASEKVRAYAAESLAAIRGTTAK